MTYGNGAYVNYGYDNLDRLTSRWYNTNTGARQEYAYNAEGQLALVKDYGENTRTRYTYDMADRLTHYEVKTNAGKDWGSALLAFDYKYEDKTNRLIRQDVSVLGSKLSTSITYGNAQQGQVPDLVYGVSGQMNGSNVFSLSYGYDGLGRMTRRQVSGGITTTYGYVNSAGNNTTTTLVSSVNNGGDVWSYEYDAVGNITKVYRNGELRQSYAYDSLNQLTRVNDKDANQTVVYTYDNGGNLLTKTVYAYTEGALGTAQNTVSYTYGDAGWKDLLTKYNGQTITYDSIGNPLTYRDGMSFTWQNGRQLSTLTKGSDVVSYGYNGDGIRTSKTVNNIHTEYYLDSAGTILAENKGGTMVRYLFDESGTRIGLYVNGAAYMYDFNVQGDVVALRNSAGTIVVKYAYDAWGNPISVTDASGNAITDASHIANLNSFRYRGYYYDAETGFYYLQSRYYDPVVGRFINADGIIGATGDILTYNLLTYCGNDPINRYDPRGYDWLDELKQKASDAWDSVKSAASDACDWVQQKATEACNWVEQTATDAYNYITNDDEQVVLNAKHIAFYKGKLVVKLPIGTNAASFGVMFLGDDVASRSDAVDTVKHEYGHTKQFDRMGIINYTTKVAVPSVAGNLLDRANLLPYDYYSSPWEYEADMNGGVNRGNYESWASTVNTVYSIFTRLFLRF